MANQTINQLPVATTIDPTNDLLAIYTANLTATQGISRNTYLGLASAPVGLTDNQTLTNKTLTAPALNNAVLGGTLTGTYTLAGTPTFPASVVTLTGSQVLTNKTLTSPTLNNPSITNATISADTVTGFTTVNSGTIYGVGVTLGQISTANTILPAALATGVSYTKFKNDYKFSVYRAAAANSGNGAFAVISYDTKVFDTNNNVAAGVFTVPIAGFYQFIWMAQIVASGSGKEFLASLFVNGARSYDGNNSVSAAAADLSGGGSAFVQLAAAATVDVRAFASTTQTLDIGATNNYFMGYLVSAT